MAVLLGTTTVFPYDVHAQDQNPNPEQENPQNTSHAVSTFTGQQLQDLSANDLSGLQGAVPNLNLVQGRGSATSANIFIRGIGQPDALHSFDPSVGVYLDGVYLSRIQGALLNLDDIDRVEVLRGPQGTSYGKNTIGGAVHVVSKTLDDQIHIKGTAALGRFNHRLFNAYMGGPLKLEKLWASVALSYDKRRGLVREPNTNRRFNDRDMVAGRAKLRARPTENLDITLSGDYTRQRNALTLGRAEAPLTQFDLGTETFTPLTAAPNQNYNYEGTTSFDENAGQNLDHWGLSLQAKWEVSDWLSLHSITAYRDLEPDFFIDIDATAFEIGDVFVGIQQDQFSQEFQAKIGTERLTGIFGLFYLNEDLTSHQTAFADDLLTNFGTPQDFTRRVSDDQNTKSYAAFTKWTYAINDQISLTTGLRYTYEEKDYFRKTDTSHDPVFAFRADNDWDSLTPSIAVNYQITDQNLVYVSATRGFKSGGFNGRANDAGSTSPFAPETVWTLEAGSHNDLLNGKLRFNTAAFYNFYDNFQARVGGETPADFPVLNVAALETWGFELETIASPIENLTLSGALGYLNADYTKFDAPIPGCDPAICEPAFAPKWTLQAAANYKIPVGPYGFVVLNGDIRHISSHFLSVQNRPETLFEDGYTIVNAFIAIQDIDRVWHMALGVKNLTKTLYRTDGQEFSNIGNIQTAYYGEPRTWQLSLTLDF